MCKNYSNIGDVNGCSEYERLNIFHITYFSVSTTKSKNVGLQFISHTTELKQRHSSLRHWGTSLGEMILCFNLTIFLSLHFKRIIGSQLAYGNSKYHISPRNVPQWQRHECRCLDLSGEILTNWSPMSDIFTNCVPKRRRVLFFDLVMETKKYVKWNILNLLQSL